MKPRWSLELETTNSLLHTKVYKLAETYFFLNNYENILQTKMHRSQYSIFAHLNFRFLTQRMTLIFIFKGVIVEDCKVGLYRVAYSTGISKVAIIKTKCNHCFFSSPPFFLLTLSFSPILVWFGAEGAQKTCLLMPFHSQWLQISLGWFSKTRLDIYQWKKSQEV